MTVSREEAETLVALQAKTGLVFCLTHNYTGYPMVRQARAMVESGALGALRVVQVEYPQEWLTEEVISKQAEWRNDPSRKPAPVAASAISAPMPSSSPATSPN